MLAKFLREQGEPGKSCRSIGATMRGATAAAALRAALAGGREAALEDQVLEGPADEAFWRKASRAPMPARAGAVARRAGPGRRAGAGRLPPRRRCICRPVCWPAASPTAAGKAGANVRLVYPSDLPPKREARLLRNKLWLHNKGIPITDEAVQMNTQFTMTVVSDVVGHIMDSFSRDFFVERIEHVVGQTPMASVYPEREPRPRPALRRQGQLHRAGARCAQEAASRRCRAGSCREPRRPCGLKFAVARDQGTIQSPSATTRVPVGCAQCTR